jgi:hypothetical protein
MKQRNIKGATLFNPRIYHQSFLNSATLQCDSRSERDFLIDCEFDKSIKRFMTQPNSYSYEYQGKTRRVTNDVRIEYCDGTFRDFEVKDARYADSQALHDKIDYISELLKKHQNSSLTLVTTDDIYGDPSHVTRKILYNFMFLNVPEELSKMAIKSLVKSDMSIANLEQRFEQKGADKTRAWAFLAKQYASIEFLGDPEISSTTIIRWSK